jgi:hypothetical protein
MTGGVRAGAGPPEDMCGGRGALRSRPSKSSTTTCEAAWKTYLPKTRSYDRLPQRPRKLPVEGMSCAIGRGKDEGPAMASGKSADGTARSGLSQGPARPAAIHVPGLRLAARRPAHAPHRHHPVGLGLLRLRADLHLAFLWRQALGRLCAVQLRTLVTGKLFEDIRDAVHEMADPEKPTTPSSSPICACRPPPACRCGCCPKRSTACASSASMCRASACRPMPKPRMSCRRDAEPMPARRPRAGPRPGAARGVEPNARPSRCWARCSRPIR